MEKQNQEQKNKTASNVLIVILILIMLATSAFGIFAWARYQTTVQGESTAQVAKWNFKVTGDKTQTEQVSFLITRTDNNQTVADGTIAPGTYGEIPIEIDVTGTQTDLVYTISGSVVNLPRNIKLYSDSARTKELVITDGEQFSKGNYLKLADIGTEEKLISETIYWEWPFETGATEDAIKRNNEMDTEDMGKAMTMALKVEGKQLNDTPALADLVQVGDYVNYDADSNETQAYTIDDCAALLDTTKSGTISLSGTISTNEAFNSSAKAQWRVLSVDRQTKEVELVSVDPTAQKLTLSGSNGFENVDTILNNISGIYDNGKGAKAESGRSLTIKDISKYSNHSPYMYKDSGSATGGYGGTYTYTEKVNNKNQKFYKEIQNANGEIEYELSLTELIEGNGITMTMTYFSYAAQNYIKNESIYNMFCKNSTDVSISTATYWLNSRCAYLAPQVCVYYIRSVKENGGVSGFDMYNSASAVHSGSGGVRPVISLETNIQTTGKNANGVWELKVD